MRSALAFVLLGCCSLARRRTLSPEVRTFVKVDAPVVALTHVRVIDGTGAAAREDQTVILSKGKIESVGDAAGGERAEGCAGARSAWIQRDSGAGRDARPHVLSGGERDLRGDGVQFSAAVSGGRRDDDSDDRVA